MVDPGDVAQGAEGGELGPQAEQFVEELLPPGPHQPAVLPAGVAVGGLFGGEEMEVGEGVKGQGAPFVVQQYLQDGEAEQGAGGVTAGIGDQPALGEHPVAGEAVAEGAPALLGGMGADLVGHGSAQVQHPGAGEPFPDGEEGGQPLQPAGVLQQGQNGPAVGETGQLVGGEGVCDLVIDLSNQFIVHKDPPFGPPGAGSEFTWQKHTTFFHR